MSLIARQLSKSVGQPPVRILSDISLEIRTGEFVALTGKSGSGKSTLLYILSGLDHPSAGCVEVSGRELATLSERELSRLRNEEIGFIFQFHYLLSELTALENVLLPAKRAGQAGTRARRAHALLEEFGLGGKLDRLPRQLSGGEQQRVAIARALVMEPKYIFADEPTGSLDSVTGQNVMKILGDTSRTLGSTVVVVTHDADFAAMASRQIRLSDGFMESTQEATRP